jgi:hypothetical protein
VLTFDLEQVDKLICDLGYLRIAKDKSAKVFLQILVRDAKELHYILGQYPAVRYAPLDYHYVLLKYLSVLGPELVVDLCSKAHGWRGVVVASWLVCLRPSVSLLEPLLPWVPKAPEPNRWLVKLALAQATGATWDGDSEIPNLLQHLRAVLAPLPLPTFSLRRFPTPAQLGRMRVERQIVRVAYRDGGLAAAQKAIKGTLIDRRCDQWR